MLCGTLGPPPMNRGDEIREEDVGLDKSHLVAVRPLQQVLCPLHGRYNLAPLREEGAIAARKNTNYVRGHWSLSDR